MATGNSACLRHGSINTLTSDGTTSSQGDSPPGLRLPEEKERYPLPPASFYGNTVPFLGVNGQDGMSPHDSFDTTGQQCPPGKKPRVTAALWEDEGSLCFQVEARGICVARREDNHMINGTKLLNVAGMTRGRRDSILKSEKVRHTVKIGPMHLKGVWIPYERALDFANREKITELLYPLFAHNIGSMLYHPTNQSRTSQIMAAAERRKAGGQESVLTRVGRPFQWMPEPIAEDGHDQTPGQSSSSSCESLHTEGSVLSSSPPVGEDIQYEDWKSKKRDEVVDQIVNSLHLWLLVRLSGRLVSMNGNSSTAHNPSNNSPGPSSTVPPASPSALKLSKRPAHRLDKSNDDEQDSDDDRYKKKPKRTARDLVNPRFLLACPYYKHDPRKYSRQRSSCTGPGWATVHRLKEHLYRRHALPEHQCPRCCCIFKTQNEMSQHLLAAIRCEIREEPTPEGFNKDQERELRLRKPFKHAASEVDHWNRVYSILFPADKVIPSPYYDYITAEGQSVVGVPQADVISMFRTVLHQFPIVMHQRLTAEINEVIETHLEHNRIVGIAHDVLHGLMGNCGIPPAVVMPTSASTFPNPDHNTRLSPPLGLLSSSIDDIDTDLELSLESIDWSQLLARSGPDPFNFEDGWTDLSFPTNRDKPA